MTISRRRFLGYGSLVAGGLAIGGCSDSGSGTGHGGDGSGGQLTWWDPRQPLSDVQREIFADFAKTEGGLPVEYTVYNPGEMGEALQLAKQGNQMPDVFAVFGLDLPPLGLVEEGWFAPLQLDPDVESELPEGTLLEGINVFDGQVYGLPVNNFRTFAVHNWFNRDYVEQAGLDPDDPPTTYEEFHDAARKVRSIGDDVYGWIAPIGLPERAGEHLHNFAEAAGSPTDGGVDLRTGEYQFHNDFHIAALEWWLAMQQDDLLFPASVSLDARDARARWAGGAAAYFFDANFCIGEVVLNFEAFEPHVGMGPPLVPDDQNQISIPQGPAGAGAAFWISAESNYVEQASQLISRFGTKDVQGKLTEGMGTMPLYPEVVETADVHSLFRAVTESDASTVFLAPSPVVRNPKVALVEAAMKPINPNFGAIVAGSLTGDVDDYKNALKDLSTAMTKERERAVKQVQKQGVEVSLDDWAFPDWQPGEDYGLDKYP